ncbi:MAG: hypothetical protein HY975_02935 [Candidatus Kerfeldbacteria bacterium]|nr:hypothetical protein [Candidatus Kerfeldbacteria bacterium]
MNNLIASLVLFALAILAAYGAYLRRRATRPLVTPVLHPVRMEDVCDDVRRAKRAGTYQQHP